MKTPITSGLLVLGIIIVAVFDTQAATESVKAHHIAIEAEPRFVIYLVNVLLPKVMYLK
jgi:hypothetical protein